MGPFQEVFPKQLTKRSWQSYFHLSNEILEFVYEKYCRCFNISKRDLLVAVNFLVCYHPGDIMHTYWCMAKEKWRR